MEHYLRRNRLSDFLDAVGIHLLMYGAATLWFVWLWGLSMPAMLAGAALGTLMHMLRSRWRQRTVARREKALRCRLGGEMMLESMLLADPREAHFRAALLIGERWPLEIVSASDEGTLCRHGDETLLIQCLRMPPEGELSQGDLIAAQRAVRHTKADRAVLCVLGKVSPKVAAKAEGAVVPLRLIRREMLLDIAGRLSPATDAQLIELGQRQRRSVGRGGLIRLIFRRDKAPRYVMYGVAMLVLYVATDVRIYAVPGMVCLCIAVCSRLEREGETL